MLKWDITPDYALNILKVWVLLCHLAAILDSGPPMVQDGRQKILRWFLAILFPKIHFGKNKLFRK